MGHKEWRFGLNLLQAAGSWQSRIQRFTDRFRLAIKSTIRGSTRPMFTMRESTNTLVGVNNMHGNPPGPAIRDAMERKAGFMKSVRGR